MTGQVDLSPKRLATAARWRLYGAWVRLREIAGGLVGGERGPLPPWRLRNVGGGDFRATGREFLQIFIEHGGLRPDDRVLDVGCGVGRMALPLMAYLGPQGSYDGFDVVAASIEWCRREISGRRPEFRFHHADLRHPVYNPGGAERAADYSFPFAGASFDFVFLTSVFTHLLAPETRRYLSEVARVLRPGGTVLATFFLLPASGGPSPPGAAYDFRHRREESWVADAAAPRRAVAYTEPFVRAEMAAAGLRLREPIRYGSWSGRADGLSLQDVVVAERPDSPAGAGAQAGRQTK